MLDKLKNRIAETQIRTIPIAATVQTKIYIFDLSTDIDSDKLVEQIYKFREKFPVSMSSYNKQTNVRAWHSDYGTHKLTNILDELIEIQHQKFQKVLSDYKISVHIKEIWINIYGTGDSAKRHYHHSNGYSTVYFPYVDKDPTPIEFDNNYLPKIEKISVVPKKDMLIICPSYLYHRVPNIKEKLRISIASNVNVNELGNPLSAYYQKENKNEN